MLGYIKAFKPELKVKDYEIYKGVYCSLCKRLGKSYSLFAQLVLSYDFTFLAIAKMSLSNESPKFKKNRCHYNPFIKCNTCCSQSRDLDTCVDAAIIMSYYKIKDNIADGGFLKKIAMFFAFPALYFMHAKAKRHSPEIEIIIALAMKEQKALEILEKCAIDLAAEPTAHALSKIMILGEEDEKNIVVLERLGYLIGRWVYLIDAVDDLEDDIKHNNFNPLKANFTDLSDQIQRDSLREYAQQVLSTTAGEAVLAFELLETKRFRAILENILYDGLAKTTENILKIDGRCDREKSI